MIERFTIESWWPLAALVVVLPGVWWIARHTRTALGQRQRRVLTALRAGALVALAFALAQPSWLATSDRVTVIHALDVSHSVDPAFVESAIAWMERAQADSRAAVHRYFVFADRPLAVDTPAAIRALRASPDRSRTDAVDPTATDLEAMLDAAASRFGANDLKRVVLMTDGNGTRGDAWRMLDRLRAERVRVFTVPANVRPGADAALAGIDVPRDVRRDEPAIVTVRVQSQRQMPARVRLERDGRALAEKRTTLQPGMNALPFTVRLDAAGLVTLGAKVFAEGDVLADNDTSATVARVQDRPRVLQIESAAESARYLRDALVSSGIDVDTIGPDAAPESVAGYGRYDAVVLSDVPAKGFGEPRMQALATWVREQGGGLVFASGANTFGENGWRESALEPVLPVTFEAQEKKRDLALVIALDRSYSMKGRKLDLAKAATLAALGVLDEAHRFALITFDSQPEITVPLAPVGSKRKAEELIARFTASGQTNIYPAMQTAYRLLVDAPAKTKHVILLSDGDTQPADFQRLVKRMADAQITVSTVAIGGEADETLMQNLANWGKGRYYRTVAADNVPQIFLDETNRVVNEGVREDPFKAVVKRRAEALRGIDFATAPPLKGFTATRARDRAEQWLATESGAPLLARWQIGLGRAVVFASDVKNRWATDWLAWPGYGKLWSQVVREVMRRDAVEGGEFTVVEADDGRALVRLAAVDAAGLFVDGLAPRAQLRFPDGTTRTLALPQVAPGRYEARVALPPAGAAGSAASTARGPARVQLDAATLPAVLAPLAATARELHRPWPAEYRVATPDRALLAALAEQTGGKVAPTLDDVLAPLGETASIPKLLWPWCAALALLLWLADLAVRRMPRLRRA